MPLLQATYTTAQVEGINRTDLINRFLRETGLGQYGTATGGGAGTLDDTVNLKSSQFTSSDWVGGWARIAYDAGGAAAAPENEHFPITTYDPTTNARITVNPAFSANPASGDKYQLFRYPNPTIVKDFLDQILKNDIYLPCWSILSEVPDFDMEQISASADWTASNATVTKVTGTEPVVAGKRWLSIATTSAAGYARTASIRVEPNKRYKISAIVMCSAASTTAELIAYDATNSASIDSKTSTRLYPTRIDFEITTPATCNLLQLRLSNQENSVTTYWDMVVLYAIDSSDIALPWWVKNKSQIRGIFELRQNQIADSIYEATLRGTNVTHQFDIRDDAFGRGQLRLVKNNGGGISNPIYIFGIRNEVAYANDNTDYKRVDENLLFTCLAYKVFTYLKQQPNASAVDISWVTRQAAEYQKEYIKLLRQQSERVEEVIQSVIPSGQFEDIRFRFN